MKKFIALFLVVSILTLSMPLTAKERKGADVIIQKTDGTQAIGELIAVKQNSLLLLDSESGADVSVDIEDIRVVKIVKKSKAWTVAKWGLLVGGIGGALAFAGTRAAVDDNEILIPLAISVGSVALIGGIVGGAIIGGLIGAGSGKDETIIIPEETSYVIRRGKRIRMLDIVLEKLRKKAKVKNFQ